MARTSITSDLNRYPCLRRYLLIGFVHVPTRDAPDYGMICLESERQRLFINPQTGYERFGKTVSTKG